MSDLKDIRWKQRFENYHKAYTFLEKYCIQDTFSELERAGFIQMFEAAFELSWKVLKDYLKAEGFQVNSPRQAIKKSFEIGLIQDGEIWLKALADRSLTVHTYDEVKAEELIILIKNEYLPLLRSLYRRLAGELNQCLD